MTATGASPDMRVSLTLVMDKLLRQAQRHVGKRQSKRKGGNQGLTRSEA
jgi:hypothetical protein